MARYRASRSPVPDPAALEQRLFARIREQDERINHMRIELAEARRVLRSIARGWPGTTTGGKARTAHRRFDARLKDWFGASA